MIADILSNKKPNPIINEVLTKGRNLYISLAFINLIFLYEKILE